jgi:transposase
MKINDLSVGIDYHQASLRVSILSPDGKQLSSRNIENDVAKVVEYVSRFGNVRGVALEACNGSAHFADDLRKATKWEVNLCHPGYVQRMRHNPDKSDYSDALLLGDLQRVGYLPKVWLAPEELRHLRTVVRHRWNLTAQLRDEKLRVRCLLRRERVKPPAGIRNVWSKKGRSWLASIDELSGETKWVFDELLRSISELERRVACCVKRLEAFAARDPLIQELMKRPGIALLTATVIRAEIGTFLRFRTGKQLSRFSGLSPRNASSGTRQADAGLIKAGNPILKAVLIQIGHNLCRFNPFYREYARSLLARGKKKCVVVSAVTNRWMRRLFYDMRELELSVGLPQAA